MRTRTVRPHRSLAVGALLAAVLLAACSSGYGGTSVATAPAAAPASAAAPAAPASSPAGGAAGAVTIKGFAFSPGAITVAVGTTVTWTNQDSASHTVTADDGSFDSKAFANGATFSQTFARAGTFKYHCAIHSSMTASVVVQ
jgi:plastocyanin